MIKPAHLRMARAGLGLTLRDLAVLAEVNLNTISRFEAGRDVLTGTLNRVERALVALGAVFVDEDETTLVGVAIRRTPPKGLPPAAPAKRPKRKAGSTT